MSKKANTSTLIKLFGFVMIPLFLSFALLVISCNAEEKSVALELKTDSVLFVGVSNPLKITAVGYEVDELIVGMVKGKIKKTESAYFLIPIEKGETTITVSHEGKEVMSKTYPVHLLPSPVAMLKSMEKPVDEIVMSIGSLVEEKGIKAILPGYVLDAEFKVVSFNLRVTGSSGVTLIEMSESDEITEKQLEILKRSRQGQEIIFDNIKAIGPDGLTRDLEPITVKVE